MIVITVARKPLEGTVVSNVKKWGTGGLNIDGCRLPVSLEDENIRDYTQHKKRTTGSIWGRAKGAPKDFGWRGRFPTNFILQHGDCGDDCPVTEMTRTGGTSKSSPPNRCNAGYSGGTGSSYVLPGDSPGYGDEGSVARFFKQTGGQE